MDTEHRAEWGNYGWACACGAGRDWPLAPVGRARAAAQAHQRAAARASLNAPATAHCDRCGRVTWDASSIGTIDHVTQPDGQRCGGTLIDGAA
jgi:hypothetical protein